MMLGETIRLLRVTQGMTPEQLAGAVGVADESIRRYEENSWHPGTEVMSRLAKVLGVSVMELVTGYSILLDEADNMLMVRHMGGNVIRVIGQVTENVEEYYRKEVEKLCGGK
jgi:transcriptional regulator with XRE-family HTH domain